MQVPIFADRRERHALKENAMQYVCDAPGRKTWFRIETDGEALLEAELMRNAIEVQYENARLAAVQTYQPSQRLQSFERNIGLKAHLERSMPIFLTLRDSEGTPLANAMLPPGGRENGLHTTRVVGPNGADAMRFEPEAVKALEKHYNIAIEADDVELMPSVGVHLMHSFSLYA
jgi:hypothetical protein